MIRENAMKSETLKALQGSIQKWQDIVDGKGGDSGITNCPLCDLYNHILQDCKGCPVNKSGCRDTPHEKWCKHQHIIHSSRYPYKIVPGCPDCKRLATAELEFLKSLLPVEKEKTTMRRVEIYEKKDRVVKEEPIRLRLIKGLKDNVKLVAVDKNGTVVDSGYLAIIDLSGIKLLSGVKGNIGIALNNSSQIKLLDN